MPPVTMLPPSDQGLTMGQSSGFSIPSHGMRRKTPSELRQEQLKRNVRLRTNPDGEPSALPCQGSTADLKKISPRLIDTRVADIFAATKPHERPKFSLAKQMEEVGQNPPMHPCGIRAVDRGPEILGSNELPRIDQMNCSVESRAISHGVQAAHILDRFRDVTEMSTAVPAQAEPGPALNMVEALKMMAPITGQGFKDSAMKLADLATAPHRLYGMDAIDCKSRTPPVDLSLKLSARFLSADSLHWCHRTTPEDEVEGLGRFVGKFKERRQEKLDCQPERCTEKQTLQRFGAQFWKALFSYVHPSPQYSVLYDMVLTSTTGGKDPQLAALYQMWEDAFSSLYYMFRYRRCNQFYYCTKKFVVMFVGGDIAGRDKNASSAYWTRSTRGFRRLLKENGVGFLMPFSCPEGDTTMEELQELTEFEQLHPGQTRLIEPSAVLDNRDISLLVFEGKNVHRLFDFLLNYRFLVGSANAKEFPTLYSPVEFKRAILHAPEVKCKRAEYDSSSKNQLAPNTSGSNKSTSDTEMMYSLELYPIGGYIPPWVIQRVCEVLQESQSTGFEASFNVGPLTEILNVVQTATHSEAGSSVPNINSQSKPREFTSTDVKDIAAEIQECRMKAVKHLKFSRGLYGTSVISFR